MAAVFGEIRNAKSKRIVLVWWEATRGCGSDVASWHESPDGCVADLGGDRQRLLSGGLERDAGKMVAPDEVTQVETQADAQRPADEGAVRCARNGALPRGRRSGRSRAPRDEALVRRFSTC